MKNKKYLNLSLLAIIVIAGFWFMPRSYALDFAPYNNDIDYAKTSLSNYAAKCPDLNDSTGLQIDGTQCPESDRILFKPNNSTSATCISTSVLQSKIDDAISKNRKGFNCLQKDILPGCRAGNYNQCGETCVAVDSALKAKCDAKSRNVNCTQTDCSGCIEHYAYCGKPDNVCQLVKVGPNMLYGQTPKYTDEQIAQGSVAINLTADIYSCAQIGKTVIDECTGECSSCPDGYTSSGRNEYQCVTFAQRFVEVFYDGLTWLGGKDWKINDNPMSHVYDYSKTGPAGLKDVYLKSDMAETLNWSSDELPDEIAWLLNNYYLCSTNADCAKHKAGLLCSVSGMCYNPNDGEGTDCVNNSYCDWLKGFVCNANGKCSLPGGDTTKYYTCDTDAQCQAYDPKMICIIQKATSPKGYCLYPDNSNTCTNNSYCDWLKGYICNADGKCEIPTPEVNLSSKFVGLSPTQVDGNRGDYVAADTICDTAFIDSHVCSSKEIINSYVIKAKALTGVTAVGWINSAAPGNITPAVNDCDGWKDGNPDPYYATVWNFNTKSTFIQPCHNKKQFACCK